MEARVKQDARWRVTTACSGREFVQWEWRVVPAGFEDEARRHPMLEVREGDEAEILPAIEAVPVIPNWRASRKKRV